MRKPSAWMLANRLEPEAASQILKRVGLILCAQILKTIEHKQGGRQMAPGEKCPGLAPTSGTCS